MVAASRLQDLQQNLQQNRSLSWNSVLAFNGPLSLFLSKSTRERPQQLYNEAADGDDDEDAYGDDDGDNIMLMMECPRKAH